jgi:hypothetical protein
MAETAIANVNLDEGIPRDIYVRVLQNIVDECNRIRRNHGWCWVWLKFSCGLHPWIVQGTNENVALMVPVDDQFLDPEWFTAAGQEKLQVANGDTRRAAELKLTYGRILRVVTDGNINMEEAQRIFRAAGLPPYGHIQAGRYEIEARVSRTVNVEDVHVTQRKFNTAWMRFLEEIEWADSSARPRFNPVDNQGRVQVRAEDTVPLIGGPERNYQQQHLLRREAGT